MRRLVLVAPLLFVVVAWPALDENSGTYDEPVLVSAGYSYVTRGDFRLNPEHPPLVKTLLALPLLATPPTIGADAERAFAVAVDRPDVQYLVGDRFLNVDNTPQPILFRARLVALALGAVLVLLVGIWAADAFGPLGGALAAGVAALDPNLLAHATLATTDVGFTLAFVAALLLARRTFRRATAGAIVGTGVAIGAAFAAKHTAVLLLPALAVVGVARVIDATPWPRAFRRPAARAAARAATVVVVVLGWSVVAWATLWAAYGSRYAVTPTGSPSVQMGQWTRHLRSERILGDMLARGEPVPDDATLARAVDARPPAATERLVELAARHRWLPEAYLFGVVVAAAQVQLRSNYLLGTIAPTGWTWYFPFALLVKTPVATLLLVLAAVLAIVRPPGASTDAAARERREAACVALVAAAVLAGTMTSKLNIGVRHVLPVVPLLCMLAGYVPALVAHAFGGRTARAVAVVACLLVAAETLAARPYFLPFFNVAAGGARGGVRLLSDSNLDWGQGLPALRRWMAEHHVERVNFAYFGSADPARYGIDFVPLPGTNYGDFDELGTLGYAPRSPVLPGWVAIGATHLQGTYLLPEQRRFYAFLRDKEPAAVPAGSTYVYWVERWGE